MMLTQCTHSESLNFTSNITAKIKCSLQFYPVVKIKLHVGDALCDQSRVVIFSKKKKRKGIQIKFEFQKNNN